LSGLQRLLSYASAFHLPTALAAWPLDSGLMVKLKKLASPPRQRARPGKSPTPHDAAIEAQLKMPNERDESVAMTPDEPDPVIEQAAVDVARGLQDTSSGAELNRAYKKLK
jgi:hypothetical protein